jgi:signal transduction histidine kinase
MSKDLAQSAERRETLARLGEFLLARREDILRLWIAAVDRSPDIPSSDDLTYKQLLDHFPQLCAELAGRLKQPTAGPALADANSTSSAHGRKRWQQGYRLDEVIRELSLIRRNLFERWLPDFAIQSGLFVGDTKRAAKKIIDGFFDEVIVGAVTQFVAESTENRKQIRHQFLSLMSHELRTPLTPALFAVEALRKEPNLSENAVEMIELIARNIEAEAHLIDELLDASQSEVIQSSGGKQ